MIGYGLGLRTDHYAYVLEHKPKSITWFEVATENFLNCGGQPRSVLTKVREDYKLIFHGVTMNLGSVDPVDKKYLSDLKELVQIYQPEWISDHLCWVGIHRQYSHDLLPISYSKESLQNFITKTNATQEFLGQEILIENPSSYILFKSNEYSEWDFLREVVQQTGCKLLLDINNIYVSAFNHGFHAKEFIDAIPKDSVQQFHLAGHTNNETHIIDTHDHDVCEEVWQLYEYACQKFAPVATMIERDAHIPEFHELEREIIHAREIQEESLGK